MRIERSFSIPLRSLSTWVWHRLQGLARGVGPATFGMVAILIVLGPSAMGEIQVPKGFIDEEVAAGLQQPISLQFAPDGRLFVTERPGTLRIIKNGQLLPTPFLTVSVTIEGSHGLMGVSFDPNFKTNGYVYVLYHPLSGPRPRISRFTASRANPDVVEPGSELVIYEDLPTGLYNHVREIPFGPDGKMYLGGYQIEVLRIDPVNYPNVVPADNPYGDAIWATGFRNPSSVVFDPMTGKLYANDVGWYESEKIRLVTRGKQTLLYSYDHPEHGGAITGGAFYHSKQFPEDYIGDYFFTDHVQGFIKRLKPDNRVADFATEVPYPIDLKVGPDGSLYYIRLGLLADLGPNFYDIQPNGSVHRIRYSANHTRPPSRARAQ